MQSCSNEDDLFDSSDSLDATITNSQELEEYIIAGVDLERSLADFIKQLNKVDFAKLEVTYDAEGKKIVHLPASVSSIGIDEKVQMLNEKKRALREKYPHITSFTSNVRKKHFQYSIQNSINVRRKLELGVNISRPLLKSGKEGITKTYNTKDETLDALDDWLDSEDYTEIYIIQYADGTYATYQDTGSGKTSDRNTGDMATITAYDRGTENEKWYWPGGGSSSQIVGIGHTHKYNSEPTEPDNNGVNDYINVPESVNRFIFYDGAFKSY